MILKNNLNSGVSQAPQLFCKSTKDLKSVQVKSEIYSDLANQEAVKAEIGEILERLDHIVKVSLAEVLERKGSDTLKYEMTSMFATDLNATIKSKFIKEIENDVDFGSKIRIRKNRGSYFFIIKDKYAIFIKKLNGKMNKPNSYPTENSIKTFCGELFVAGHLPFLFVGPNPKKGEASYVTSLINRKEVNWTTEAVNLFNYQDNELVLNGDKHLDTTLPNAEINKDIVKIKRKIK